MNDFVVVSDLHAHPWSAFSQGDGLDNTRLQRSLAVLEASLSYAQQHNIPWLFAGDLVHTAGYALNVVLAGVLSVMTRYQDVPMIMVWGNHDARGVGGKIKLEQTVLPSLMSALPRLVVIDPTCTSIIEAGGVTISGAGYQPRIDLLEMGEESDVGLYHQTVMGSFTASGHQMDEGIVVKELLAFHRLSIVGHIHHAQSMDQVQRNMTVPRGKGILIPGSPEQHTFGDCGDHGWWIVSLPEKEKEDPKLKFMHGGSPEFRTVETPAAVKHDGNFYRVRNVPKGEALPEGALAVAPTPTTVTQRHALKDVGQVEQVLQVWMKQNKAPKGKKDEYLEAGRELLVDQNATQLRDVRLSELRLKDFCSFENTTLIVNKGMWLLTGKGRDYPSNGAGKTTLVGESLYWLLFGRTTKGMGADEVIRWGTDGCEVQAVFDDNGDQLIVTRCRGPLGHTLHVEQRWLDDNGDASDDEEYTLWEAASVNEMTTRLNEYLGITPEIFQNLAYFSQEKLLLFSSATDGERKNVLADLIGLSAYQSASEVANKKIGFVQSEQMGLRVKVEVLQEQLEGMETTLEEGKVLVQQWEEQHKTSIARAEFDFTEEVKKIVVVEDAQTRYETVQTETAALLASQRVALEGEREERVLVITAEYTQKNQGKLEEKQRQLEARWMDAMGAGHQYTSLDEARQGVGALEVRQSELDAMHQAFVYCTGELEEEQKKLVSYQADCRYAADERGRLGAALKRMEDSLADGVCPTCQQEVAPSHRDKCLAPLLREERLARDTVRLCAKKVTECAKYCDKLQADRSLAASHVTEAQVMVEKLEITKHRLDEVDRLTEELAELSEATTPPTTLIDKQVDKQIEHELMTHRLQQQQEVEKAQRHVEKMREAYERCVTKAKEQLERIEAETNPHLAVQQNTEESVESIREQQHELEGKVMETEQQIAMYDYWRIAFSKQGIQSLLVEEIAVLFNDERANIFPMLTQGVYDVQFSTLSKTRKGEAREKTEFQIFEHGVLIPYGILSGGQRRRIDIGIMLVLVQAVSRWMGIRGVLGLLILDEVFGFLDANGAEGLLAALQQVAEQVQTIYVITHDTHLQSMVPDVIRVEQNADGISTVLR